MAAVIAVFGGAIGDETRVSILRGVPSGGDSSRSKTEDSWFAEGVATERAYSIRDDQHVALTKLVDTDDAYNGAFEGLFTHWSHAAPYARGTTTRSSHCLRSLVPSTKVSLVRKPGNHK